MVGTPPFQLLLVIGSSVLAFIHSSVAVKCNLRRTSTCICDMDDGSGYLDLTAISKNDGTPFFTLSEYRFNPCYPFVYKGCKDSVAVCQSEGVVCGKQKATSFTVTSTNPLKATIDYGDGDDLSKVPRVSIVTLVCDTSKDGELKFDTEHPRGTYHLTVTSKHACLNKAITTTQPPPPPETTQPPPNPQTTGGGSHHHRTPEHNSVSLGTILDICTLLIVSLYLTGGVAYMYVRKGERGRTALPNYEFWIALPGLIKEGFLFILHGVKSRGYRSGYDEM
ncbi:uncharacterized protein LOC135812183 [Sycon ciliatum]|uniref:uncharacterized protein LOC135812183 n=1 Tax=Sycon ciliatum TaxID=27933 RepID=UPI0031F66403